MMSALLIVLSITINQSDIFSELHGYLREPQNIIQRSPTDENQIKYVQCESFYV